VEVAVGKDNRAYFLERAAEELAAAERSGSSAAASAHRELSLRYSLRLILPERAGERDDGRPIGQPRRGSTTLAAQPPGSPEKAVQRLAN
jgi:hypothetical protein